MQKSKITILSTRPVGKLLVEEAALHNIIIDEISFIRTQEIIDNKTKKKIEHLSAENINAVFTSMNAVESVKKFIPANSPWRIFCIGNTTAKLVSDIFGKKNIAGTADNAFLLAENIAADPTIKRVYFFCGDKRRDELPQKLREKNIDVDEVVVYKTIEIPRKISKKYDGILFFSPSAVQSFFLKNSLQPNSQVFAIGSTTADALKPFTRQHVITADTPGKRNLVEQAIKYFCQHVAKT